MRDEIGWFVEKYSFAACFLRRTEFFCKNSLFYRKPPALGGIAPASNIWPMAFLPV
jgi:hypothetical protein